LSSNKQWLGLIDVNPEVWHEAKMVEDWWRSFMQKICQSKRVISLLAMFVSWEIWKERNACVFRNHFSVDMVMNRIKDEVAMWSLARAKVLIIVIP
jgi:hypothetical protein